MNHNRPLVSIVTVNFNQSQATCDMLESLYACGYSNLEVIVVDNASPNDHPEIIKERFPEIIFIKNRYNTGFAGGNNVAIKKARGEYIYLLNNDTIIPLGNIERLLSVLQEDMSIGVVCPKIKFYTDPNVIQFAGYTDLSKYTFRNRCIGYGEQDRGQYNVQKDSAFAHGAAMMVSREAIKKAGLMNEHYFLYYEELDWSTRIKNVGYKIMYVPDAFILHKESLSTGKSSPLQTYYLNRNRVLYIRCNTSGMQKIFAVMYQMFLAMPKNILIFGIHGQFNHAKTVLRAWFWNIKNMCRSEVCDYGHLA